MLNLRFFVLISIALSFQAVAGPIDLSTWQTDNTSNWSQSTNQAQTLINTGPSALFSGNNNLNSVLEGRFGVMTSSDDDFIGFVLGLQPGELASTSADYWLIDWKQNSQSVSGQYAQRGLSISHVSNGSDVNFASWYHGQGYQEVERGNNFGSSGWADNTWYDFSLSYTAELIEFSINGLTQISLTATDAGVSAFGSGSFGLYANSQQDAAFSNLSLTPLETPKATAVPSPATHLLLGLGLLSLVAFRKKRVGTQ